MDIIYKLVLVLHFIGVAMLVGGFFAQMGAKPPLITHWMRDGVLTQLITGLVLVGIARNLEGGEPFDTAEIGTKLLVALVVTLSWSSVCGKPGAAEALLARRRSAGARMSIIAILVAVFVGRGLRSRVRSPSDCLATSRRRTPVSAA